MPFALPAPSVALVGRRRELAAAQRSLLGSGTRLLTLTGPGGVGKTRLAIEVAHHLRAAVDGVIFVNLAALTDPVLVAPTIVRALGAAQTAPGSLIERIARAVGDQSLLLLLDNFEHLLPAAPLVAELLATCPRLHVLVTSRAPLRLSSEHEFPVAPLALPFIPSTPGGALPNLQQLAGYDSVALFIQSARAVKPDFRLDADNAHAVAQICARLDGLPLAIELAAARVKLFPPPALLARLDRRLSVLIGGARDLAERQQTLRSAIDWSYDLLDLAAQRLFARMAVFVGGAALDAAEAVCGVADLAAVDVLASVASLVDFSLLQATEAPTGEPRLSMLETLREYALERLQASSEAPALRRAHAAYFAALAAEAEPALRGPQQAAWLDRLERDAPNLREALRWFLESTASGDDATTTQLLTFTGALWRFWQVRGHLVEGRRWLEQALALPMSPDPSASYLAARAEAAFGANVLLGVTGDAAQARARLEECLHLWNGLGDAEGVAWALYSLGEREMFEGHFAAARSRLDESAATFRRLGSQLGLAWTHLSIGLSFVAQQNSPAARAPLEQSAALFRSLNEQRALAIALVGLGFASEADGDDDAAWDYVTQALAMQRALLARADLSWTLEWCAGFAAAHGHPDRAARLSGAAVALREYGGIGWALPGIRELIDRRLDAARQSLGDSAFALAFASGQAMSLEDAIHLALVRGEARAAGAAAPPRSDSAAPPPSWAPLSERERDVAALVALGLTNRQIAQRLVITTGTAGSHVTHILEKLGLHSRAQIAAWAVARQLSIDQSSPRPAINSPI